MRWARRPSSWVAVGIVGLGVSWLVGDLQGFAGMAIGLASATFGVLGLWLLTKVLEVGAAGSRTKALGVVGPMLTFGAKIPVYYVCGVLSTRIGGAAFSCFIAGIVLVYSSSVVWAAAAEPPSANSPDESPAD